ncbi:hypothetical protein JCM10213_003649 [Rhodosporidiobolus nylandii]
MSRIVTLSFFQPTPPTATSPGSFALRHPVPPFNACEGRLEYQYVSAGCTGRPFSDAPPPTFPVAGFIGGARQNTRRGAAGGLKEEGSASDGGEAAAPSHAEGEQGDAPWQDKCDVFLLAFRISHLPFATRKYLHAVHVYGLNGEGHEYLISSRAFPSSPGFSSYLREGWEERIVGSSALTRVEMRFEVREKPEPSVWQETEAAPLDKTLAPLLGLFFPGTGRTLWTNPDRLSSLSPYWNARLRETEFPDQPPLAPSATGGDDSDDETDSLYPPRPHATVPAISGRRVLTVSTSPFTTNRAMVVFLARNTISFAPLTSSYLSSIPLKVPPGAARTEASSRRLQQLREYQTAFPSAPLPVSPASTYALAHFLDISTLREVALEELQKQLTPEIVVYELFGPTAATYDEVKEMLLAYVREHKAEVRRSSALERVQCEMEENRDTAALLAVRMLRGK